VAVAIVSRLLHTRVLVRAPIALYRAGLGPLLGSRMLMLEHVGRTTGARRQVVLEVLLRPGPGRYVIVSGLGRRSQWYRNVLAQPQVRVSTGWHRLTPATVRQLPASDAVAVFGWYAEAHSRLWATFEQLMSDAVGPLAPGEQLADRIPLLEVDLR